MNVSPELALAVALLALVGVLVTALVALFNARKRGDIDERLLLLKTQLDGDVTRIQQAHAERLAKLEHSQALEAADRARIKKADGVRLQALLQELDPKWIITFLRDHDFGGAFRRDDITALFRFVERTSDPDQDFLDAELQGLYLNLVATGKALSNAIALKTAPTNADLNSVLPLESRGVPRPAWVDENAKVLNDRANDFVGAFDSLIRAARAKSDG